MPTPIIMVLAITKNIIPSNTARHRGARVLTAVVGIGLCVFAVFYGCRILAFTTARDHLAAGDRRAGAVRAWYTVPGLAGFAGEAILASRADATDMDAARQRGDDLAALLVAWPLSSSNWLSLAGVRMVTAQPYEKVLDALAMSSVTGPNEGGLMFQRGIFGLLQWEVLPGDFRNRTIVDLAGMIVTTPIEDVDMNRAKHILAAKAADTRREVAALLRIQGVPGSELARMGL